MANAEAMAEYKFSSAKHGGGIMRSEWTKPAANGITERKIQFLRSVVLDCDIVFAKATGTRFSNVPETFRARKAISKTMKAFM